MIRTIATFLIKRVWRRLHPKYTKDELIRKRKEAYEKLNVLIRIGDKWGAINTRRKAAQYQLRILRITYLEDLRLIKERCKK